MAFIDEMELNMKAGDGGDGIVAWLQEKSREFGGPSGGNGGRGGDVYVRGVRDYGILSKYRNIKDFHAERGGQGRTKSMWGKNGDPLVLDIPIGSVLTNLDTGKKFHVLKEGELVFLLKGGKGGYGNEHFKASTNVSPEQFTLGKPGEAARFFLELQLVVDLGFAGFPNAGKSSLLNVLTNAEAKVGSYAFTTLEPNLGELYGYILADIPGLIEGASSGKGLGYKFLRHVQRTKAILHCISLENEDLSVAYKTVRKELETYSKDLAVKEEIVILTKTDVVTPEVLKKKIKEVQKLNKRVYTVSVYDDAAIKELKDNLVKFIRTIDEKEAVVIEEKNEEEASIIKGDHVRFESDTVPTTGVQVRTERVVRKLKRASK